jgi:hypothetical protein
MIFGVVQPAGNYGCGIFTACGFFNLCSGWIIYDWKRDLIRIEIS